LSTADSDTCSASVATTSDPRPSFSLSDEFSFVRLPVTFLRLVFSWCKRLFSSSSCATTCSRLDICCFLRSLAVWAATLFFSFLLIILSSGERCVSLRLFLGPGSRRSAMGSMAAGEGRVAWASGRVTCPLPPTVDINIVLGATKVILKSSPST